MRPPTKLHFRSALCLVLLLALPRLQAADSPELIEPLRRLEKYVGDWKVSWKEDGQLQHGTLQVRPNAGGTLLQSGFIQKVNGKVIWSSVSVYFWRSDLGRLAMFSIDSTGRREESVQTQSGDHEIWQGPGAHDAKGVLETAIAHTDWSSGGQFTWRATHAYRRGKALPDSPLETYVRVRLPVSSIDPQPDEQASRLGGPLRRLARLPGAWDSETKGAGSLGKERWRFTSGAGGHLLLGELISTEGASQPDHRLDLFYFAPELRRIERLSFGSDRTQGRWALERRGTHEVWQGIEGRAADGSIESSVLDLEWNARDQFVLTAKARWGGGVLMPDSPASVFHRHDSR